MIIVFSDLDGTILDSSYSATSAREALKLLRDNNFPLVINSGMTAQEILTLIEEGGGGDVPFICENGGAIYVPRDYFQLPFSIHHKFDNYDVILLGLSYESLRENLEKMKAATGVDAVGFGQMSIQEVAKLTGISAGAATAAKKREYDEPFIIRGEKPGDFQILCADAEIRDLRILKGTRFYHLTGRTDKGIAMDFLVQMYSAENDELVIVAVGDSPDNLEMLSRADLPFLVRKFDGTFAEIDLPDLRRLDGIGPEGFGQVVRSILKKYKGNIDE